MSPHKLPPHIVHGLDQAAAEFTTRAAERGAPVLDMPTARYLLSDLVGVALNAITTEGRDDNDEVDPDEYRLFTMVCWYVLIAASALGLHDVTQLVYRITQVQE